MKAEERQFYAMAALAASEHWGTGLKPLLEKELADDKMRLVFVEDDRALRVLQGKAQALAWILEMVETARENLDRIDLAKRKARIP